MIFIAGCDIKENLKLIDTGQTEDSSIANQPIEGEARVIENNTPTELDTIDEQETPKPTKHLEVYNPETGKNEIAVSFLVPRSCFRKETHERSDLTAAIGSFISNVRPFRIEKECRFLVLINTSIFLRWWSCYWT